MVTEKRVRRDQTGSDAVGGAQVSEKVLKFDQRDDVSIREHARKEYEVAKLFKSTGLPAGLASPFAKKIQKEFNIDANSDLTCVEIKLGKDLVANADNILQVKEQLAKQSNVRIVSEKEFTKGTSNYYGIVLKIV